MSYLFQAINISEKKNSNSADFHEILEAGENVWIESCACYWTSLSAAFMTANIIIWRILTCFLKKTDYSDSDSIIILEKELNCSSLCQTDLFCNKVKITEY